MTNIHLTGVFFFVIIEFYNNLRKHRNKGTCLVCVLQIITFKYHSIHFQYLFIYLYASKCPLHTQLHIDKDCVQEKNNSIPMHNKVRCCVTYICEIILDLLCCNMQMIPYFFVVLSQLFSFFIISLSFEK